MKHFELHIIQSVPVSCLNRDDFGSPKSAFFGGVPRARISSQCWKRAARRMMAELAPDYFKGERTRLFIAPLARDIEAQGFSADEAGAAARAIADKLAKLDAKKGEVAEKVKTLFFSSPKEMKEIARLYAEAAKEAAEQKAAGEKKPADPIAAVEKALKKKKGVCCDAADIALFGRMVASFPDLGLEGAAMFNHALSTGRVSNEVDFFTAVDDLQPEEETGAGMAGTQEFNSAVYYRFTAVDLGMLFDESHLADLPAEDRKAILKAFIEAVVKSVPQAKQNSMNAATLPSHVLAVVRDKGHPVQLVNAFEEPVKAAGKGIVAESVQKMLAEYEMVKKAWGIPATSETAFDGKGLTFPEFLEKVVNDALA